jgi:hypothetical protein
MLSSPRRWSASRNAVFLPMPGSFDKASTAFSNSMLEYSAMACKNSKKR